MSRKRSEDAADLQEGSVVERLREEITSSSDGVEDIQESDISLLSLFSHLSEEERSAFQHSAADELLINGENLETGLRERLMEGAVRGLAHRRKQTFRLQAYLEYLRAEANLSAEDVAEQIGLTGADVEAVERGERPLTDFGPDVISDWIGRLKGDVDNALIALRQSLGLGRVGFGYSERDRRLSPEDQSKAEALFQAVESKLTST